MRGAKRLLIEVCASIASENSGDDAGKVRKISISDEIGFLNFDSSTRPVHGVPSVFHIVS